MGSAQHSKALLTSKKTHIFQPLVGSTAESVLWEKAFPKGRFSSSVKGQWPGWVRKKVAMARRLGKAMPPPGSLLRDQRTPQSCSVASALVFVAVG